MHEHHTEEFAAAALGCTEPLLVTGTAHILLYAQNNPGGRVHFHTHTNLQGVSAVGQITGTRYSVAQNFNAEYNYAEFLDPPKLETNHVFRYRVMGSGPENNFRFDATYHVTITPDGRVTATFLRIEGHCAEDGARAP